MSATTGQPSASASDTTTALARVSLRPLRYREFAQADFLLHLRTSPCESLEKLFNAAGGLGRRCARRRRSGQGCRLGIEHRQYVRRYVERPFGKKHAVAQHQIDALSIRIALDLLYQVTLHFADFRVAPGRGVVLELPGLARELALLIAQGLFRLGSIGLRHDRALFLQFLVLGLEVVLY